MTIRDLDAFSPHYSSPAAVLVARDVGPGLPGVLATKPAVSVVIPTHNRCAALLRSVRCVLDQVGPTLELIVVDDGSTDYTRAFLDSIGDSRLRVLHHGSARGTCAARNAGIHEAHGQWVAFLDDDDLWSPFKLSRQLSALERTGAGWSCTSAVTIDESLRLIGWHAAPPAGDIADELLSHNVVPGGGSSVMADAELLRQFGGFDEQLQTEGDWELWIRLGLREPIASVQEPLTAWTSHGAGISRRINLSVLEVADVHRRFEAQRQQRGITVNTAEWSRWFAETGLRNGRRFFAARQYLEVARATRDWRALALAIGGLISPRVINWRDRRRCRRMRGPALAASLWLTGYGTPD